VIFRLGRVIGAKGPGLFFIIPIIDKMVKVNLQTVTMDIPPRTSSPRTTSPSG
jgi:regulator of protease activity HflC (stomatin/prohibitin superfamily)